MEDCKIFNVGSTVMCTIIYGITRIIRVRSVIRRKRLSSQQFDLTSEDEILNFDHSACLPFVILCKAVLRWNPKMSPAE